MNFGTNQTETTSTNKNIFDTSQEASTRTPPAPDTLRNNPKTSASVETETHNLSSTALDDYNSLNKNLIKQAKSFTTPQNSLDILSSIQNFKVSSDYNSYESFSVSPSRTITPSASIVSLEAVDGLRTENQISQDDLRSKDKALKEHLSTERATETTSSSIPNIYFDVSTLKTFYSTTENDCSQSEEYLKERAEQINEESSDCQDNTDDFLSANSDKISINSENLLRREEISLNKSSENYRDDPKLIHSTDYFDKKGISRVSERAKKKSWYNVLYPNYKSRTQDFKKLFKEVPNDERLIVDYSCALYRDLLIQGRLYISQNYVCFHANILGWETCLIIKWKDVTSITKEKTALVIPNAISICTPREKFFFSSFATRDKTFLILFRVWQNTLMNKQMPTQEIWQLVHNYYGDELGLTTDDEDYVDPTVDDQEDSASNFALESVVDNKNAIGVSKISIEQTNSILFQHTETSSGNSASDNNSGNKSSTSGSSFNIETMKPIAKELTLISAKSEDGTLQNSQTQPQTSALSGDSGRSSALAVNESNAAPKDSRYNTSTFDSKRKVSKSSRQREENTSKNSEALPTDVSDSSDSEDNNIPFVATAECNSPHEGRQLVHTILPINIETLFNLLFSKSKFLLDFHAMRKSTDLVFNDWIMNEDGQKSRIFNVTVQLAASVGPKTSKVTEFQVMRECSKPGELYSIDINNVNAGIPYADSFSVLVHYCLVKTVDDHTMLSVHAQIKYKKSIWGVVKGFIEKNTWAGLDDFYSSLLRSLQSETCIPPAKGKGRRPRRGTATQSRPLEDMPTLQSKPEPTELCGIVQTITTRHSSESPVLAAEVTTNFRWLSLFVLVLLCFLIIVNVILLLKLWKLEERIEDDMSVRARFPNLSALKQLPNSHQYWIELLRQQEALHKTELKKWHTVLQTAIELLKKTEKTLAELMFR